MMIAMVGCSQESVQFPQQSAELRAESMVKWARSCALCHVNGEGGAPKAGDIKAWEPRLAQSNATLVAHMVDGFNRMPPLGYCMDCSEADLFAMVEFMAGVNSTGIAGAEK